jgi:hypothetical protein
MTALKTAYSISEPVRCYLNAINREKRSYVCSLKSPKMWPTVYQLMDGWMLNHSDTISDDALIFRCGKKEKHL